jgi:hypothetical protein
VTPTPMGEFTVAYILASPDAPRCSMQDCGGYARTTLTATVDIQSLYDPDQGDTDVVAIGICEDHLRQMLAGRDFEAYFLHEVSP